MITALPDGSVSVVKVTKNNGAFTFNVTPIEITDAAIIDSDVRYASLKTGRANGVNHPHIPPFDFSSRKSQMLVTLVRFTMPLSLADTIHDNKTQI